MKYTLIVLLSHVYEQYYTFMHNYIVKSSIASKIA